jgi:hypothetical protein
MIVAPFIYYGQVAFGKLISLELPDSFAYLWREPFNWYFFTGRSLTQRLLFSMLGTNPALIVTLHFALFLITAVALYLLFKRPRQIFYNMAVAAMIMFYFSSYTLNVASVLIISEPIFVMLLLIFPCALFLARGKYRIPLILAIGVAFIFSKNVAPYALITLIFFHWFTTPEARTAAMLRTYAGLILLALISVALTSAYDTSTQINTVNNIYKRIFPNSAVTRHFQDAYGMPDGPFIAACQKSWIGDPCFGMSLIIINQTSRNYELVTDQYGFVTWLRQRGQRAYMRYLLWEGGPSTYAEFQQVVHKMIRDDSVIAMNPYLGVKSRANTPNNLATLAAENPGGEIGFFGFDPFLVTRDLLLIFKFDYLEGLYLLPLAGLALARAHRFAKHLPLATAMIGVGLLLFFLGYFGDGMEEIRHVFPAIVALQLGGVLYLLSLGEIGLFYLRRWRQAAG